MTTTERLPPGIYRIAVANSVELERHFLTNGEDHVTILPPGVGPGIDQEWRVRPGEAGDTIIERPTKLFPSSYLTYKNAPKGPEVGDRVVSRIAEFPLNEWRYSPAGPQNGFTLRVARSEFGIRVAPPMIYPPFLELANDRLLEWRFEFIRSPDE